MHAILATVGTDGDVFPYLGLGCVLRVRGHRVTLAGPETYRGRALALGLEFCPLVTAGEVEQMLGDPDMWHPLKGGLVMARWGLPMVPRQYEALAGLAREPDTVFVANPGLLAARLVQETLKVPLASLVLQPGLIPSCSAPPEMPGGLTIPDWLPHRLRRAYWWAVDAAGYLLVGRGLNRFGATLGLPRVRRLFRWWLSPDLAIGLFPAWYAEPQTDWPQQIRLAGFARYDGGMAELPDDIRGFCQFGPDAAIVGPPGPEGATVGPAGPPVAFTLGTGMAHAAQFFREAVAACGAGGVRGILLTKYPDLIPPSLPPTVRHCTFAPFLELLPLCGAIVHHGGIGTTAAALEAGCPQLVLPLAWDQPDNAARVRRLGVGLALGRRQRGGNHVARALLQIMTPAVRERCRDVAKLAARDNGLEVAADWVEQMAARAVRLPRR